MPITALSPYPWIASFAFALLWLGFAFRKRGAGRGLHVALMSSGMALDIGVVLILELSKNAVATAMALSLNPWQQIHVYSSTLAVLLYVPVFVLGFIRWRQPRSRPGLRAWHMRLGIAALALRTIGFLFMFSMIGRNS